jgi:hypothetical protein
MENLALRKKYGITYAFEACPARNKLLLRNIYALSSWRYTSARLIHAFTTWECPFSRLTFALSA